MVQELLMGNQAIGMGAIRAGVRVVTGYPGTPSTEILETIAEVNPSCHRSFFQIALTRTAF